MSDLISRQAAIGIIQSLYPGIPRVPWLRKHWQKRYEPYINAEKMIRTLPSAQSESQWIPVTKKAHPDLPIRVQVQMNNGWIITAYWDETDWFSVPDWDEIGCPIEEDEYHKIEAWRELPELWEENNHE